MSDYHRELIEHTRKVQKLLSLYILALQEDTALEASDHEKLAGMLRAMADAIEAQAGKAPASDATNNHPVIEGALNYASKTDDTTEA